MLWNVRARSGPNLFKPIKDNKSHTTSPIKEYTMNSPEKKLEEFKSLKKDPAKLRSGKSGRKKLTTGLSIQTTPEVKRAALVAAQD
jgi:hypothetical protein